MGRVTAVNRNGEMIDVTVKETGWRAWWEKVAQYFSRK